MEHPTQTPKRMGRSSRLPLFRQTGRKPVPQRSQPRTGRQHQRKQQGSGREARKRDSIHRRRRPEFPIRIRRLQPSPILQHGFLGKADPIARPGGHRPPLQGVDRCRQPGVRGLDRGRQAFPGPHPLLAGQRHSHPLPKPPRPQRMDPCRAYLRRFEPGEGVETL